MGIESGKEDLLVTLGRVAVAAAADRQEPQRAATLFLLAGHVLADRLPHQVGHRPALLPGQAFRSHSVFSYKNTVVRPKVERQASRHAGGAHACIHGLAR